MKKLLPIIASCFCFSCELVVDVDVPMENPKITVNALFSSDSIWRVHLHKSKYILDEGVYEPIDNAQVLIKENGNTVEVLNATDFGEYVSASGQKPAFGHHYEIEVSAAEMETVTAQSTLPSAASITSAVFAQKEGGSGFPANFNFTIDVTFQDDPNADNYYEFVLMQEHWWINGTGDTVRYMYPTYIFTDDAVFGEQGIDGVIFDDKVVNGKEVQFIIKGHNYQGSDTRSFLIMRSLSRELFLYKTTAARQSYTSGDPFAQPVRVFNNIRNGFGIFGGYSEFMIEIDE